MTRFSVRSRSSGSDDLSSLPFLDERVILDTFSVRYRRGDYYTYIGDVLVFLNPFKNIDIYGTAEHQIYTDVTVRGNLKPHPFWLADDAHRRMLRTRRTQCILVSGESGSGKTESVKHMISHVTHKSVSIHPFLDIKINEVNPLLEAFGNAMTAMNDNSSRFGKYLELRFTANGKLAGAVLSDYLLEKTRIVQQGPGERNFHIFYYMFAGMTREELRGYNLQSPESYRSIICKVLSGPNCGLGYFPFQPVLHNWFNKGREPSDIGSRSACTPVLGAYLGITNFTYIGRDFLEISHSLNHLAGPRSVNDAMGVKYQHCSFCHLGLVK